MPIPRITYEALVKIWGEELTSTFYTPVSVVRR
jgi:hypothetical protein